MVTNGFEAVFGASPDACARAPGRVNLIGEHTDYNGGAVLPMPIARLVEVTLRRRDDRRLRLHSAGFGAPVERDVPFVRTGEWSDYVAAALAVGGAEIGYDVLIDSDIPAGSGVSSSAALIVATLRALRTMDVVTGDDQRLALTAQSVENGALGVPCGIMDQMAVSVGVAGRALFLDTASLVHENLPLFEDHAFVTLHSGVERRLDESRYKTRRNECEDAARRLGVDALCTMPEEAVLEAERLPPPLARRARHQLTEHTRVIEAAQALRDSDASAFGRLMNESHVSMRDDFDITHPVLDRLVEQARKFGALGSRMTGGGFGGCFVSLVRTQDRDAFIRRMSDEGRGVRFVA